MTMTANSFSVRDDFRCGLCRQKNAFHCEHDTPYRDQYLGVYDPSNPQSMPVNNRRAKSETATYKQPVSNGGINPERGRQVTNNRAAKYEQNQNMENITTTTTTTTPQTTQKAKSCVIL